MDKYNFVLFLEGFFEFNRVIYKEVAKRSNVKTLMSFYPRNGFLKKLYRLHHSKTTNSFFSLPFKSVWFGSYFKNDFEDPSKPLVFVFNARLLSYDYIREYAVWLRKRFPGCKLVANYMDIVATWPDKSKPDALREIMDMLVSYDRNDADKYRMHHHPTVYQEAVITKPNNTPMSDVFFLGGAKNRMKMILETYDKLDKAGLNCCFYVMDSVPPYNEERSGIHYLTDDAWMPYEECIQHVQHSKCVLEIMQKGAVGETLRVWEAITYGKMLLTNNAYMTKSRFYNPEYVCMISENGDIDAQKIKDYVCKPNPLKDELLPEKFLQFIAERL